MDIKGNPTHTPKQIPHMLVEYLNNSTAIHMTSGEFTYVTPWSINYHSTYGHIYVDRSDTRNQELGGTLNTKIIRIGVTFALDLTATTIDDLSRLAKPSHLSEDEIETIVVFDTILWPTSTRLGLAHLHSAIDFDCDQATKRKEFNLVHQQLFGTTYTFAKDECDFFE